MTVARRILTLVAAAAFDAMMLWMWWVLAVVIR